MSREIRFSGFLGLLVKQLTFVVVLGIGLTCFVAFSFYAGYRVSTKWIPLRDASMLAKLKISEAHVQLETVMAGETIFDTATVFATLDAGHWTLQAIVDGGTDEENTYQPVNDEKVEGLVSECAAALDELRTAINGRLNPLADRPAHKPVDSLFEVFMSRADELESEMQEAAEGDIRAFRLQGFVIVSACLLATVLIGIALRRYEKRQIRYEEQKRNDKEKLDRAERLSALSAMAGGVAHDLNNMLGPLVGYADLLLRKLPDDSPYRTQVEKIQKSAGQVVLVVDDLLTLARRGRYMMTPMNLNHVVDSYLDSLNFQSLMSKHPKVTLVKRLTDELPEISGSESHLMKTIMNLVVNACEAMPGGGKLSIETSHRHLTRLESSHCKVKQGMYVCLRVADTGTGIAPEDLPRVFDPFFSRKKMSGSGSGLGVSVVYGVVKDHHGYYDVTSQLWQGTQFMLHFPVTPSKVEKTETTAELTSEQSLAV